MMCVSSDGISLFNSITLCRRWSLWGAEWTEWPNPCQILKEMRWLKHLINALLGHLPPPECAVQTQFFVFWWYSYNGSKILLGGLWGVPNVCDTQCVRRCVNICLLPGSALSPSAQFPIIALFVRYLASCSVSVLHLYSLGLPVLLDWCRFLYAGETTMNDLNLFQARPQMHNAHYIIRQ